MSIFPISLLNISNKTIAAVPALLASLTQLTFREYMLNVVKDFSHYPIHQYSHYLLYNYDVKCRSMRPLTAMSVQNMMTCMLDGECGRGNLVEKPRSFIQINVSASTTRCVQRRSLA